MTSKEFIKALLPRAQGTVLRKRNFMNKITSYRKVPINKQTVRGIRSSSVTRFNVNLLYEVEKFSCELGVDRAYTPPSSWFNKAEFYTLEKEAIFRKNWIAVGRTDQVEKPGQYFSGNIADEPYVVVRDQDNELRGFFNVCRHHATQIVQPGEGSCDKFTCPYHGWTYLLNGRLSKATRLKGIKDFTAKNYGLLPIRIKTLGPIIFAYFGSDTPPSLEDQLKPAIDRIDKAQGFYERLQFVRRVYDEVKCNWKVFVDNYLDGGYHVPILHKDLTSNLDIESYRIEILNDNSSLQSCGGKDDERLGREANFAYLYPNFMLNRYGPWLDTNLIIPIQHDKCLVVLDYYLEKTHIETMDSEQLNDYVSRSLVDSAQVQEEDKFICENVQIGLKSSAYDVGRYAPKVELADHKFHQKLASDYRSYLKTKPA